MKFQIAYADGSPSASVTIDGTGAVFDSEQCRSLVYRVRSLMPRDVATTITKYAVMAPSINPHFDLDYRFLQASSDLNEELEVTGDCGHSMLAAVASSAEMGLIEQPLEGTMLRVRSLNTDAKYLCEATKTSSDYMFHTHLLYDPPRQLKSFLPLGTVQNEISYGKEAIHASVVNAGNPYVFVLGSTFGLYSARDLFGAPNAIISQLEPFRVEAQRMLKLPRGSAFPKIALLTPGENDGIAVRAVYQDAWHPSFALTGTIALAAAQNIQGTLPSQLVTELSNRMTHENIETCDGMLKADFVSTGSALNDFATKVIVKNKKVAIAHNSIRDSSALTSLKNTFKRGENYEL